MHQIPHLGIGSYILIDVELILLVPRRVRLNPAGGVDHMAGGFLDTRVRSGTHRRRDGRAQDPIISDPGEGDGQAAHVGMGLHPQLALDWAAARDNLFWDEAVFAQRPKDVLSTIADPLYNRAVDMLLLVPEGKAPDHPACLRVGIGSAVALPVIQHHQPLRTQRHALRMSIEQVIDRDALLAGQLNFNTTEAIPKPIDNGAGGSLSTFYRVLTGQHGVGEGAKEPGTVDGFCGLRENDVRGAGYEGNLARLQRIQTYHSYVGVHSA